MPGWSADGKPDWAQHQDNSNNKAQNTMPSNNNINSYEAEKPAQKRGICCALVGAVVSVGFLGLFITGAVMFENDHSPMDQQWLAFYCYQAAVAAFSILFRVGCNGRCERLSNSLATGGLIWSIVLIIMTSITYKNAQNGKLTMDEFQTDVMEENDQNALELATSLVGFVNCAYHMMLYCCCSF